MTVLRAAMIAFGCLLTLSACGPSNGFSLATKPCGENVGPEYTSIGGAGAAPVNLGLGSASQGCS